MVVKVGLVIGSARDGSLNRQLGECAASYLREYGGQPEVIDLGAYDLPIYSDALEQHDFPERAKDLQRVMREQDALIFITPEYNGSISGLLKNAIDWASRSIDGDPPLVLRAFRGKPAAVLSASPSPFGGMRAQTHLRQILSTLQMLVVPENVALPNAHTAFDAEGGFVETLPAMLLDGLAKNLIRVAVALKENDQ